MLPKEMDLYLLHIGIYISIIWLDGTEAKYLSIKSLSLLIKLKFHIELTDTCIALVLYSGVLAKSPQ